VQAGLPCLSCSGSRSAAPAAVLLPAGELLRCPTAGKRRWRADQDNWPCLTASGRGLPLPAVREDVESGPSGYTPAGRVRVGEKD
jgi:hypothetical protein